MSVSTTRNSTPKVVFRFREDGMSRDSRDRCIHQHGTELR